MIDHYVFGSITVEGIKYKKDILIACVTPVVIVHPWIREKGHDLCLADIDPVIQYEPRLLIIGTGMYGELKVDSSKYQLIKKLVLCDLYTAPTEKACEVFNEEIKKRNYGVAFGAHITC